MTKTKIRLADQTLVTALGSRQAMLALGSALKRDPDNPVWNASLEKILASHGGRVSLDQIDPPLNAPWIPGRIKSAFFADAFDIQTDVIFIDTPTISIATNSEDLNKVKRVSSKSGDADRDVGGLTKPPLWTVEVRSSAESGRNMAIDSESAIEILSREKTAIRSDLDALKDEEESEYTRLQRIALLKTEEQINESITAVSSDLWGLSKSFRDVFYVGDCSSRKTYGLISYYLRGKRPEVYVGTRIKIKGEEIIRTRVCPFLTLAAESQLEIVHQKWATWLRSQPMELRNELEEIYNRQFGGRTLPDFQGYGVRYGIRDTLVAAGVPEAICRDRSHIPYLKDYQVDSALRYALSGGIIGFDMGLGKTYTAIAAIALRKLWGINQRVMISVPANVFNDWQASIATLTPNMVVAAIPPATPPDKRSEILAEAIAMNADIILLTKEGMVSIPVSPADIDAIYAKYQSELEESFAALPSEFLGKNAKDRYTSSAARVLQDNIEKLKASRLTAKERTAKSGLYFGDLGVDLVIVDEIQYFKNNEAAACAGIAGLSASKSARSAALELMINSMRVKGIEQPLIGLTGTPEPTNSITGLYTMLRYFAPEELKRFGTQSFESFLMTFCKVEVRPEQKTDGSYAEVARIRDFSRSKPELMQTYFGVLEYLRYHHVAHQFAAGDRPTAIDEHIRCELSPAQRTLMGVIVELYRVMRKLPVGAVMPSYPVFALDSLGEPIEVGWLIQESLIKELATMGVTVSDTGDIACDDEIECDFPRRDKLIKDLKKALKQKPQPRPRGRGFWVRKQFYAGYFTIQRMLRNAGTCSLLCDRVSIASNFLTREGREADRAELLRQDIHPNEKLPQCARKVAQIFDETSNPGKEATQLIVIDQLLMPGFEITSQQYLRELILEENPRIKPDQITIMSSGMSRDQRSKLQKRVRDGEVRILISSRELIGVGANIQKRLYAIHSIDVAWRPDIVQQLKGRIERQGNLASRWYGKCHYFQYVTVAPDLGVSPDSIFLQILMHKIEASQALLSETAMERGVEYDPGDELRDGLSVLYQLSTGDNSVIEFSQLKATQRKRLAVAQAAESKLAQILDENDQRYGSIAGLNREIEKLNREIEWKKQCLEEIKTTDLTACTIRGKDYPIENSKEISAIVRAALLPTEEDITLGKKEYTKDKLIQYGGVEFGVCYEYEVRDASWRDGIVDGDKIEKFNAGFRFIPPHWRSLNTTSKSSNVFPFLYDWIREHLWDLERSINNLTAQIKSHEGSIAGLELQVGELQEVIRIQTTLYEADKERLTELHRKVLAAEHRADQAEEDLVA